MLTVGDIMTTDVITISPEATVRELAETLSDAHISGAPVVDSKRALVGVVSAADIVRFASEPPAPGSSPSWDSVLADAKPDYVPSFFQVSANSWFDWSVIADPAGGALDETKVKDLMTTVPFSVPAETSVSLLAQFLAERKIHRAIVTGPDGLLGIVTAFDVLQACSRLLGPTAEA